MKRYRIRIRLKIYPVLWCVITFVSIYLLVRFAALSFSDDIGQAGFMKTIISKICTKAIESAPSLISYTANEEEQNPFLLSLVEDRFAMQGFIEDNSVPSSYAQDYSSMFQEDRVDINTEETVTALAAGNTSDYIGFDDIAGDELGLEYILTNGAIIRSEASGRLIWDEDISEEQLSIGYLKGEISPAAENTSENETAEAAVISTGQVVDYTMEQLMDVNFLVRNFYFVDGSTTVTDSLFDADKLLNSDMTMKQEKDSPQILIYHTHSQETFIDSRPGEEEDTVVGVGSDLAKILSEDYGYNVIHDKTYYDVIGEKGYNEAYTQSEQGITKALEENPSLEVLIDLHRDSGNEHIVIINGEETAQIMLFNGLCRDQNGPITNLDNPNLQDNLAFSFQLQIESLELYPGLFKKNYLKCYRYNMHFRPKSLLMELGSENNTVQAAKNAMIPFAQILDAVLKGKK